MPYAKRARGRYARRRPAAATRRKAPVRARRTPRRKTRMNRSTVPFPPKYYTKLVYAETVLLANAGDAGPDRYTFRLNSLYDPNQSGAGGQPRFFDSLCGNKNTSAPYFKYMVYGAKVTARFVNDGAYPARCAVGFYESNDSAASNLTEARMRNFYKVKSLSSAGNGAQTTITSYMSMARLLGRPKQSVSDEDSFSANYNANPNIEGYIDIVQEPMDAINDHAFNVYAEVRIVYYCKFFQRNDVADS